MQSLDDHGHVNERFEHYCTRLYELSIPKWSTLELPELPLQEGFHWRRYTDTKDMKDEVRHDVALVFDQPQRGVLESAKVEGKCCFLRTWIYQWDSRGKHMFYMECGSCQFCGF